MSSRDLTWKWSQTKFHKKTFLRQPGRVGKTWRTPRNYLPKKCVGCASGVVMLENTTARFTRCMPEYVKG